MATIREAYVAILTEMVTEDTQKLYLEDFLYYYNKAISEYMKKRYELFEVTQQLTDDLRVWKAEFMGSSNKVSIDNDIKDYRHLLNCIVGVGINYPDVKCDQKVGKPVRYKASRMTSNIKAGLLNNEYLKATFYRPYFDIIGDTITVDLGETKKRQVKTQSVYIEYLRQPAIVDLTEEQVQEDVDNSQALEFSRDVGEEIIKGCIMLLLERDASQRLQSNPAVNQSINDLSLKK